MPVDPTKPVRTKSGLEAEIAYTDMPGTYPWAGRVKDESGEWEYCTWTEDGHLLQGGNDPYDLGNIPEKRVLEGWVNVYPDGEGITHKTKEKADRLSGSHCIACIHIRQEYEVGEGLE